MYICFKALLGRFRSSVVELNRNAVDQGHGDISESEQFLTPWAHLRFNKIMRAIIHRFQGLVHTLSLSGLRRLSEDNKSLAPDMV